MPDKQQKNNDDRYTDTILDNAKLKQLLKKYATIADDNLDALAHEIEKFSPESVEEIMSSYNTLYEENDKLVKKSPDQTKNTPSPGQDLSRTSEQCETESPPKKKKTDRDYHAGMRIVYEDPDGECSVDNKQAETDAEQPFFSNEKTPQELPSDSLLEADKSTDSLADLFKDAQDDDPVKEKAFKRFAKNVFPCRGDSFGEILRKTVLNIAVLTMIVCGGILLDIYVISPFLNNREAQKTVDLQTNSNPLSDWVAIKNKYPNTEFPTGMQSKFADLFVTNKDFVGWLDVPGTEIKLPVVQGVDNAEYLKKSFYGEKSKYGCCFVDSKNGIAQLDRNTVIYGHNMKSDNLMLGPLEDLRTIDGFKNSPLIDFSTLFKDTKWKIYAVFITNGTKSGDNGYLFNYISRSLSSDDIFMEYIEQIDQRKLYTTGVDILPGDKILTISTCVYDFKDARLAIVARMVRDGESEEIDLSKAVPNKSPRYPQAWYTAKGQSNPYKSFEQWSPN